MKPGYQEQILYILNKHHSIVTVELGDAVTDDILQLIDSAKREELEALKRESYACTCSSGDVGYVDAVFVEDIDERLAQLEQSEESI